MGGRGGITLWGQQFETGVDGHLAIEDHHSRDSFNRLRVSMPVALFDGNFSPYYDTDLWDELEATSGTVTHNPTTRQVTLSVATTANSRAVLSSRQYLHYQPGRGQLVLMTGCFGALDATNVKKRIGYFGESNGLFFEGTGGLMYVVVRTKTSGTVVDYPVVQSSWNYDKMDGTGPSRKVVDWAKRQIFVIQFQWLGVGQVIFGLDIDGEIFPVHMFNHANTTLNGSAVLPYMQIANLPVRYEVVNTGATGTAATMTAICANVSTEGGQQIERGKQFTASATAPRAVTSRRALVSIRPTLDWDDVENSYVYRGDINLEDVHLLGINNTGTGYQLVELVYNPTLTVSGGALTWARTTGSAVEYCLHGDANAGAFTNGTVVSSWIIPSAASTGSTARQPIDANVDITARWPLCADIAGTSSRVLSVVVTNLVGSVPTAIATINWREIY